MLALRSRSGTLIHTLLPAFVLAVAGCASQPPVQEPISTSCVLEPPGSMATLHTDGRRTLSAPACRGRFEDYLRLALERAVAVPDERNRARFAEFVHTSIQEGWIGEHQAKQLYNRYFHTTYVTLPGGYNLCSELRNKSRLLSILAAELEDKRRGMLVVSADRAGFQEAQRQYNDLVLLFEATAVACASGPAT